jgi:hypothetical protein
MGPFSARKRSALAAAVALGLSTVSIQEVRAAISSMPAVNLEPIIGYERVQKLVPTAHSTDRLLYGVRATAGIPLVSMEAEYTQSSDTENFYDSSLTIKDSDEKLKIGVRSTLQAASFLSVTARAGGQATRNTHTETSGSTTTSTVKPITYRPYAGVLLNGHLGSKFSLSGGITVVFTNFPEMSQNEYQTTLGFGISLP